MNIIELKSYLNALPKALDTEDVVVLLENEDGKVQVKKVKSVTKKLVDDNQRVSHVLAIEI